MRYRDLIHERLHRTYDFGARHVNDFDYDRFFAATDTLFDVDEVLFVARQSVWPESEAVGKLWMYGALQALYVQQNATKQIGECFNFQLNFKTNSVLKAVRDKRAYVAGHPSRHQHAQLEIKGCTYVSHRSLSSKSVFEVVTLENFGRSIEQQVNVPELIERQAKEIEKFLSDIWQKIESDSRFDPPRYESNA